MSAKRVKKGDYGAAALQFIDRTEQTEEPTKNEPEEQQIEGQTAFRGFDPREASTETSKGDETAIEKSEPEKIPENESVQAKPIATAHRNPEQFEEETEMEYLHRSVARSINPKHGYYAITDTPDGGIVYTKQKKSKRIQLVMQPLQHDILKEIADATGVKPNGLINEFVWRGIKAYYEDLERQHKETEDSSK